ncbi:MAG: hypothetical protein AABY18_08140 [Candidatus Thermoplasmatota archaeon]
MRVPVAILVAILAAGCLQSSPGPNAGAAADAWDDCRQAAPLAYTLFFASGHHLVASVPAAGSEPGNAFSSGFLTNDLKEWLSDPVADGLWLVGDVTLDYWVRSTGSPAPLVIGGDTGEGYHFFNQFGSDRTLQPSYATEYSTVAPMPGTVDHYTETLPMPEGGFVVEAGDRVRVLLTDLALDGPMGSGHDVLFGGETPSQVRFTAKCFPTLSWPSSTRLLDEAVSLPANQGLLTGAVPPREGSNVQTFRLTLPLDTQRLTIRLTQTDDANPVKDDIDLVLIEVDGNHTWGIGSPYSDERGVLWADNLAAAFPRRDIDVQVNSYSGLAYTGRLVVTAERASLD